MITSVTNSHIKHAITLREKSRARNQERLFIAEGFKLFEEAPVSKLKEIYYKEESLQKAPFDKSERLRQKLQECQQKGILVEEVSEEVLKKLSDTQTPQGIVFIMEQFSYTLPNLLPEKALLLLLEDIQDPGNLGTMIRTAEGAGASGVILSKNSVDIYNPKTIRSTMGSLFRVPFLYTDSLEESIHKLKEADIRVYATHLKGSRNYDEIGYTESSAFLIGNEGNGLKDVTAALADCYVRIPMEGQLESLNAAVAAALFMYQTKQDRSKAGI